MANALPFALFIIRNCGCRSMYNRKSILLIYLRELLSRTRYIFLNLNILNILEQIFQSFFSGLALSTPGRNWFPDFHDFVLLPIGNWQSGLVQECVTRPENRLRQIQRKSLQGFKYVRDQYACFGYHVPQLINKIWARNPDNKQFNSAQ